MMIGSYRPSNHKKPDSNLLIPDVHRNRIFLINIFSEISTDFVDNYFNALINSLWFVNVFLLRPETLAMRF